MTTSTAMPRSPDSLQQETDTEAQSVPGTVNFLDNGDVGFRGPL